MAFVMFACSDMAIARCFTGVLRRAGAPVDSNTVERTLTLVIMSRKNALFYKTLNGARKGHQPDPHVRTEWSQSRSIT